MGAGPKQNTHVKNRTRQKGNMELALPLSGGRGR